MIWVLTESHNDYNQHGDCFIHAWTHKPTVDQIRDALGGWISKAGCDHILTGGGRQKYEDSWYNLVTVRS